jgi:hypothetical protein
MMMNIDDDVWDLPVSQAQAREVWKPVVVPSTGRGPIQHAVEAKGDCPAD